MKKLLLVLTLITSACSMDYGITIKDKLPPQTPNSPTEVVDDAIIKARTEMVVFNGSDYVSKMMRPKTILNALLDQIMPFAKAYTGTTPPSSSITITYNLAATNVNFALTTGTATAISGDIITVGNFSLNSLDDNKLRLCPASGESGTGTQKCATGAIRVKLVDLSDAPIGGATSPDNDGVVPVTISNNTGVDTTVGASFVNLNTKNLSGINRLRNTHFTTTGPYTIKIDSTNAGAGSYSLKVIVEYVLYK